MEASADTFNVTASFHKCRPSHTRHLVLEVAISEKRISNPAVSILPANHRAAIYFQPIARRSK